MKKLDFLEHRMLSNGLIVFVKELNIKDEGSGKFSWFDIGMTQRQEGVNPCKMIPAFLNNDLLVAQEFQDEEKMTSTLMKIGDWLAGWIFSQQFSEN